MVDPGCEDDHIIKNKYCRTFIIRGWIKETCLGVGVISYYNV